MTITEFLTARLDEDEALARHERPADGGWHHDWHTDVCGYRQGEYSEPCQCHVPARVLAGVEAKRRIVDAAVNGSPTDEWLSDLTLEWVLERMALPYADHPDYNGSWRP